MNAYDVAIERFGDAIIEHFAMALDALDALHWTAQSHSHPTGSTAWVARVAEIRLLFPAEWVEIRRFFEENEERMGVMRLYAAFEARIKRDGNWRALLREIHTRGHEIGIHPGYHTYRHPEALARSVDTLRRVLAEEGIDQPRLGGCQHFLRWETPTTARLWDDEELDYDSTLSFADRPGRGLLVV